jgi:ribosomal protein S27E
MPENEKKAARAVKADGEPDPSKLGKVLSEADAHAEVQGRSVIVYVVCPHCGSPWYADLEFEGQFFNCPACDNTVAVYA